MINRAVIIWFLSALFVMFFGHYVYSQSNNCNTLNDIGNDESLKLPRYNLNDSSLLPILEISAFYSAKIFDKNKSLSWIFDVIVNTDTIYYRIIGTQWHNLIDTSIWSKEEVGIGIYCYKKYKLFIRKPSILINTESNYDYLVNDLFIKTKDSINYNYDPDIDTNLFEVYFNKSSEGYVFIEAIHIQGKKIKNLNLPPKYR